MTVTEKAAAVLGMHPEQVAAMRDQWEASPHSNVIRALMKAKLEEILSEKLTKLRRCTPEELKTIQGGTDALEVAISTITGKLL
jgi:hypothetical protein